MEYCSKHNIQKGRNHQPRTVFCACTNTYVLAVFIACQHIFESCHGFILPNIACIFDEAGNQHFQRHSPLTFASTVSPSTPYRKASRQIASCLLWAALLGSGSLVPSQLDTPNGHLSLKVVYNIHPSRCCYNCGPDGQTSKSIFISQVGTVAIAIELTLVIRSPSCTIVLLINSRTCCQVSTRRVVVPKRPFTPRPSRHGPSRVAFLSWQCAHFHAISDLMKQ